MRWTLLLLVAALGQVNVSARHPESRKVERPTTFIYHLPSDSRTSAGVFDPDGHLIRTLWSGNKQSQGAHVENWDGLDDEGRNVPENPSYRITVLANNVAYHWDGLIGNTEDTWTTSTSIWDGIGFDPRNLRIVCGSSEERCWVPIGYAEGTSNLAWLMPEKPNSPHEINVEFKNQNINFVDVDFDSASMYLASAGAWFGGGFVTKLQKKTGSLERFDNGNDVADAISWRGTRFNAIDQVAPKSPDSPTGIAVQDTGKILAVAHKGACNIRFFDKMTGAPLGTPLSDLCVDSMGFTSEGLWVLAKGEVSLIKNPAGANVRTHPVSGLSHPVSLATNKKSGEVVVLDGGASQQVKEFSSSGTLVRRYGRAGGYLDWNPTITTDRLMVDDLAITGQNTPNRSWIKVSSTDELWICDGGNAGRILHISAKNRFIDQIMFSQETYSLAVPRTEPTRIFRGFLEYQIDYAKDLQPGDPSIQSPSLRSWSLIRNWAVGAAGAHNSSPKPFTTAFENGFVTVERLSNQRVYGQLSDAKGNWWEVELPISGDRPLRFTGQMFKRGAAKIFQPNGDLAFLGLKRDNTNIAEASILENHVTGFDEQGNPIRSDAPVTAVKVRYLLEQEPPLGRAGWGMGSYLNSTSNGTYLAYRSNPYKDGVASDLPHLAGARANDNRYVFGVQREKCITHPDHVGSFPCKSGYGGHAGIGAQALGPYIFTAYDGQYSTWGNTFSQYSEDGLFIGQFGEYDPVKRGTPLPAGFGGNFAVARFTRQGNAIYLYLSSESGHAPVQRWSITNLSSILSLSGTVGLGKEVTLR